jgi:hypothetical protein
MGSVSQQDFTARLAGRLVDEYPADQRAQIKECYGFVERVFGENGDAFIYKDQRGALMGPFPTIAYDARMAPAFLQIMAGIAKLGVPSDVQEVVVLTVAAKHQAGYALYSHGASAKKSAVLGATEIGLLSQGRKPPGLNTRCSVAYDAMRHLLDIPGPMPQEHWDKLLECFGKDATVGFVHCVGFFCYMSMVLNATDAPVPQ